MKNRIKDTISNIGDKIKSKALIYSAVGLAAITVACNGPKREKEVLYGGRIGDANCSVWANTTTYRGNTTVSSFEVYKFMKDGAEIRYVGDAADTSLSSLVIVPPDSRHRTDEIRRYSGKMFDAAEEDFRNIISTIPSLEDAEKVEKNKADEKVMEKYFK